MDTAILKLTVRNAFTASFFVVFLCARLSVSQSPSMMEVSPSVAIIAKGGEIILTCKYDRSDIGDVRWLGPNNKNLSDSLPNVNVRTKVGRTRLNLYNATAADQGMYKCEGYSKSIDKTVDSTKYVTVFQPIKFVNTDKTQKFELGSDAIVRCNITGNPPGEIEWEKGGKPITNKNTSRVYVNSNLNVVIPNIAKSDEGFYKCIGTVDSIKEQEIDIEIFVDVVASPSNLKILQSSKDVMQGDNITLTCSASGEPTPTYSWYRGIADGVVNSILITEGVGNDGSTLSLINVKETNTGNYTCMAKNEGNNITLTTEVTVLETSSSTTDPQDSALNKGGFDLKLIIIIVVVFIVLLILLDFVCCMVRQCGVFHCIYFYTCAPTPLGTSEKAAEEGSAEFRQESGAVNEQTPLHKEHSKEEVKEEAPPKKEDDTISPEDVKMEVCSQEKEPLA